MSARCPSVDSNEAEDDNCIQTDVCNGLFMPVEVKDSSLAVVQIIIVECGKNL